MDWMTWYNGLAKPIWTPSPSTIGLIWQILYPIILVSFLFVFIPAARRKIGWRVALPFAINLVVNVIFTPIQFGLRNRPLASVDIPIVWGTIQGPLRRGQGASMDEIIPSGGTATSFPWRMIAQGGHGGSR